MSVVAGLSYEEQVLSASGEKRRAARHYDEARADLKIKDNQQQVSLAAERRLLGVSVVRDETMFLSAHGALTRDELDLINVPGNSAVADGLLPLSVGTLTFEYIKPMVREAVRVTDDEIGAAVKYLWQHQGLRVEPSGAVCVAALLTGKLRPAAPTAVMLTGGNVDPALFQRLVA